MVQVFEILLLRALDTDICYLGKRYKMSMSVLGSEIIIKFLHQQKHWGV